MTDSKNKDIAQNLQNAYMPTQNRLESLILKVCLEIQAYMKPTLSLHKAYTEPTQNWEKLGKSVTMRRRNVAGTTQIVRR